MLEQPLRNIKSPITTPKKYDDHSYHPNVGSTPPPPGQDKMARQDSKTRQDTETARQENETRQDTETKQDQSRQDKTRHDTPRKATAPTETTGQLLTAAPTAQAYFYECSTMSTWRTAFLASTQIYQ